jgi:hypothetical protein
MVAKYTSRAIYISRASAPTNIQDFVNENFQLRKFGGTRPV